MTLAAQIFGVGVVVLMCVGGVLVAAVKAEDMPDPEPRFDCDDATCKCRECFGDTIDVVERQHEEAR